MIAAIESWCSNVAGNYVRECRDLGPESNHTGRIIGAGKRVPERLVWQRSTATVSVISLGKKQIVVSMEGNEHWKLEGLGGKKER